MSLIDSQMLLDLLSRDSVTHVLHGHKHFSYMAMHGIINVIFGPSELYGDKKSTNNELRFIKIDLLPFRTQNKKTPILQKPSVKIASI